MNLRRNKKLSIKSDRRVACTYGYLIMLSFHWDFPFIQNDKQ